MCRLEGILIVVSITGCQAVGCGPSFFGWGDSEQLNITPPRTGADQGEIITEQSLKKANRLLVDELKDSADFLPNIFAANEILARTEAPLMSRGRFRVLRRFVSLRSIYEAMVNHNFRCTEQEIAELTQMNSDGAINIFPQNFFEQRYHSKRLIKLVYDFYVKLFEQCSTIISDWISNYGMTDLDRYTFYDQMYSLKSFITEREPGRSLVYRARKSLDALGGVIRSHRGRLQPIDEYLIRKTGYDADTWINFIGFLYNRILERQQLEMILEFGVRIAIQSDIFSNTSGRGFDRFPDILAYYYIYKELMQRQPGIDESSTKLILRDCPF